MCEVKLSSLSLDTSHTLMTDCNKNNLSQLRPFFILLNSIHKIKEKMMDE